MSYPHFSGDCDQFHDRVIDWTGVRKLNRSTDMRVGYNSDVADPTITTLCGSTRFKDEVNRINAELTMQGHIVISMGVFGHADLPERDWTTGASADKRMLDELHRRKIDLADLVYVVNPGGYIGESTRGEIAYATGLGKRITYLVDPQS